MKVFIIFLLTFIILYLSFLLSEKNPYTRDSFGGKKERANLQNINDGMGIRKKLTDRLSLVNFNDSEVLVVTSNLGKCGILLNCEYPPYYKSIGNCKKMILTFDEFNLIRKNTHITTTVRDILSLKME
jgi:hypothetical protein